MLMSLARRASSQLEINVSLFWEDGGGLKAKRKKIRRLYQPLLFSSRNKPGPKELHSPTLQLQEQLWFPTAGILGWVRASECNYGWIGGTQCQGNESAHCQIVQIKPGYWQVTGLSFRPHKQTVLAQSFHPLNVLLELSFCTTNQGTLHLHRHANADSVSSGPF